MGLFSSIGSFVGNVFGGGNKKAERGWEDQARLYQEAVNQLKNVNAQAGPSDWNNVKSNPALQAAQMRALGSLQGEAAQGGMTSQDRAVQNQMMDQANAANRGNQEAITQNMTARGQGGGGGELAARLQSQQGNANQTAMASTQNAANARQRALQAMSGAGQMAGGMEQQQFGEQAARAQALDALQRFNAGQRLTQATGVGSLLGQQGNMLAQQGQQKKQQNEATWGGGGGLVDSVLSFL